MGVRGALARSGAARAQAGLRDATRARGELPRHLRGSHWTHRSVRAGRPPRHGQLRLAIVRKERVEGRAHVARHQTPAAEDAGGEVPRLSYTVSRVQGQISGPQTAVLRGPREMDPHSKTVL